MSQPSPGRSYPARPMVGIGIIVLRQDAVLLIRRSRPPSMGSWSLPGGAQELGETAIDAARRELLEETGLTVGDLILVAHADSIHRDTEGRVAYHYTILDFAARSQGGEAVAGADAGAVVWAPFERLDAYALWSETRRVIAAARAMLADAARP